MDIRKIKLKTMKKNYIAPATTVMAIKGNNMICTSLTTDGTTSDNGITNADSRMDSWLDDDEVENDF